LRGEILAAANVCEGDVVVEIGCGKGPLLTSLADAVGAGGRVIGIEPQRTLARLAEERVVGWGGRCEIRVERATETTLADGLADACIAQTVLCHVQQPERDATLARMMGLTRVGGRS
jgi:tRNA A58 N-methylase Trm61